MSDPFAPTPVQRSDGLVVAPDVERVDLTIRFDVARREAAARAVVELRVDQPGARPAFDLRQPVDEVLLDGRPLPAGAVAHADLGGGDGAAMRVLDVPCERDRLHRLELVYLLGTPDAAGAVPIGWEPDGVRFDLWMSDLEPGRYLEMWAPAPLCHDRFALGVDIEVVGTERPHVAVTNAADDRPVGLNRWRLRYPDHFTSLSPMLVLSPADAVEARARTLDLPGRDPIRLRALRHGEVDADLAACEEDIAAWLTYLHARYGGWCHGGSFTAFVWGPGRGMEYDGATTSSVRALEHEVFHSWFGRGLKPSRASDGWIDEAWTSWATATSRRAADRFAVAALPADAPPVVLCPAHPWSRCTPRQSYTAGAALFAAVADAVGGADRLRSAMAAWYRANAGGLVTTDGLRASLEATTGADLRWLWDRFVHGRERPR